MDQIRVGGYIKDTSARGMGPCEYYRVYLPLRELGARSDRFDTRIITDRDILDKGDEAIISNNIWVMSRVHSTNADQTFKYCQSLKRLGVRLVFDADDDLSEEHREFNDTGPAFRAMVQYASLVTTTTVQLADRLREWATGPVVVLPNALDTAWFAREAAHAERIETQRITVGVVGTWTHDNEYWSMCDVLSRCAEDDRMRVVIAGGASSLANAIPGAIGLPSMPYALYPQLIAQFDIVLCAVDLEDPFNLYKSPVKALEAMAVGAIPVCSPTRYYRDVIDGRNGILVKGDHWLDAINSLVGDPARMAKMRDEGQWFVHSQANIANEWVRWANAYAGLAGEEKRW